MHDLALLLDSPCFSNTPTSPTRVAFVHRSFRSVGVRRGIAESFFKAHFPALGLLNLAQAVRLAVDRGDVADVTLRYFDEDAYEHEAEFLEAIKSWLEPAARRVVAASSYTQTIDRLEQFLAQFQPERYLIMVGGAHASVAPDIENVHMVVRGEGAAALNHVLGSFFGDAFAGSEGVLGLNYVLNGRKVFATPQFDRSLEAMPSPAFAYDLLPDTVTSSPVYATSFSRMLGARPQIYVCTQSCRARCTFCSTYLIHGRTVARPLRLVRRDLEMLADITNCDSLEFHDDDLGQHPEFEGLLDLLDNLGLPWFCYMRVDGLTPERATRMAASGCRRVFLGIESMNQPTLDYFNKQVPVQQNVEAASMLAEAGVDAIAGFIIGAPNHTVELIRADLEALLALPLYCINCTILSPDPATVEFVRARQADRYGPEVLRRERSLRLVPDVEKYGMDEPTGLPTVCEAIDKVDLSRLQAAVNARFYFRPHIYARLQHGRSIAQAQVVDAYYEHVAARLSTLYPTTGAPELLEVMREARDQVLSFRPSPPSA